MSQVVLVMHRDLKPANILLRGGDPRYPVLLHTTTFTYFGAFDAYFVHSLALRFQFHSSIKPLPTSARIFVLYGARNTVQCTEKALNMAIATGTG